MSSDSSYPTVRDKLVPLLAWAIETQRKSPTKYYRDYYGGYVQAVKDILLIYDTSPTKVMEVEK